MNDRVQTYGTMQLRILALQNNLLAAIDFPGAQSSLAATISNWAKKLESTGASSPVLELHASIISKFSSGESVQPELFSLGLMAVFRNSQPIIDLTGDSGQFVFAWESFTICGVKRREEARDVASILLDMANVASHYPKTTGLTEIKYRVFVKRAKFLTVQPDRWIKLIERARASGKIYS